MLGSDVLEAIKASVKVNLAYIDKVVIVCSGRIEKPHSDSIKKFLKWLSFSEYKDNFVFIYNKADQQSSHESVANLATMCNMFGVDATETNRWRDTETGETISIDMNLTTGFPPGASFDEIERDHTAFTRALLCEGRKEEEPTQNLMGFLKANRRIPVDKTKCRIL